MLVRVSVFNEPRRNESGFASPRDSPPTVWPNWSDRTEKGRSAPGMMAVNRTCAGCGDALGWAAQEAYCPRCLSSAPTESGEDNASGSPIPFGSLRDELGNLFDSWEWIATGGMGVVFRARQKNLGRMVAVKVLPPHRTDDAHFFERFRREAQVIAGLKHPNIITIYDFARGGSYYYIVMEFVEGQDLAKVLLSGLPSFESIVSIMVASCDALHYAHDHGIVHRDVKPANILIGPDGAVKVTDFGILKLLGSDDESPALTTQGQYLGTPLYVAPEQRRSPMEVDQRADVFSLGVVFYEMLTGQLPSGGFDPPSTLNPGLNAGVDAVVLKAIQSDPAKRFQSAAEFKVALQALAGMGVGEVPFERTQRVLLFTGIVDAAVMQKRIGAGEFARVLAWHDDVFRLAIQAGAGPDGEIVKHTGDGFMATFSSASKAIETALRFCAMLSESEKGGQFPPVAVRMGLHQGEVLTASGIVQSDGPGMIGVPVDIALRLMGLAGAGQILMTKAVFDDGRQSVQYPGAADAAGEPALRWCAHGRYLLKGDDEPIEVYEVGLDGSTAFVSPADTDEMRRSVSTEDEATLGWRPGVGLTIPKRPEWTLEKKLGEGGFGEAWLARHNQSHQHRVFKFCFDAERLRSFKRELVFFRLITDALGDRTDIAKLYEIEVDSTPYFLESEYCKTGNLVDWAAGQGGLAAIPLETLMVLFTRIARAVASAHSMGIIHKDIKPSNIFVFETEEGPRPKLADFGIGSLSDDTQAGALGITLTGFSRSLFSSGESSRTGTRLYAAPEYLIGKPPSVQGDIYALGVVLYQMVVGRFDRPLGAGWERDVRDIHLRGAIASLVDADPAFRMADAGTVAAVVESIPRRRRLLRLVAPAAAAAFMLATVYLSTLGQVLEQANFKAQDYVTTRVFPTPPLRDDFVLVGIDDHSLNLLDHLDEQVVAGNATLDAMSFGYPFPRSIYATLLDRLIGEGGARLVVFDMLFLQGGAVQEDDEAFQAALDRHADHVVLGAAFQTSAAEGMKSRVELPSPSIIGSDGGDDRRVGCVNLFPDFDGLVREVPYVVQLDGELQYPSLATAALEQLGAPVPRGNEALFRPLIRFPERDYEIISLYSIFEESLWKEGFGSGEAFSGKIVFVGATSEPNFHDVVSTPRGVMPGVQVQMHALATLQKEAHHRATGLLKHLPVVVMALVGFLAVARLRKFPVLLAALAIATFGYLIVFVAAYLKAQRLLPLLIPLFVLLGIPPVARLGRSLFIRMRYGRRGGVDLAPDGKVVRVNGEQRRKLELIAKSRQETLREVVGECIEEYLSKQIPK